MSFSNYGLLNDLRAQGRILEEAHQETGSLVKVMLDRAAVGRLEGRHGPLPAPRELVHAD